MSWSNTYPKFTVKSRIMIAYWTFFRCYNMSFIEYHAYFPHPLVAVYRGWLPYGSVKHFLLEARPHKPATLVMTRAFDPYFQLEYDSNILI